MKRFSSLTINSLQAMRKYDPREFYLLKDKVNDIQLSSIRPTEFSRIRTSPLIVMDDEVLIKDTLDSEYAITNHRNINELHHQDLMDDYNKKHSINETDNVEYDSGYDQYKVKNVGVGSTFGLVAILEYIQGSKNKIKRTLIDYGFKKIYINNNGN